MTPRELGPYLLLRKLSENALCETYRAGQRSGQEVERVVLLYFFNTEPDDSLWIAETAQAGRRALAGLDSPSLSPAVDSGEIAGAAYLTYDYIPGRSLEVVLEKARSLETAVPIEHALLVTDRIAQGLLAAWEHESRALHGFVVPHLVMLSNEGDVQLLGLEVASRLRKLLTNDDVSDQMSRYLAPEVVPEGQPATTDDVYSLGAILCELLTGKTVPPTQAGVEELLEEARTHDGKPLPGPVVELLRSSLTPSPNRSDLKSWQTRLGALLASGEYDVNAFNLALFLHSLFPDEIETEAEEALEERGTLGPTEAEDTAPDEVAHADDEQESEAFEEIPPVLLGEQADAASSRGRFLAIAATVIVVLLGGFAAFSWFGPSDSPEQANLTPVETVPLSSPDPSLQPGNALATTDTDAVQPAAAEAAAGLSPEEIDRRVQDLLQQRSADMETSLRREFEAELADLRQQLEQAKEEQAAESVTDATVGQPVDEQLTDSQANELRLASLPSPEAAVTPEAQDASLEIFDSAASGDQLAEGDAQDSGVTTVAEGTGAETTDLLDAVGERQSAFDEPADDEAIDDQPAEPVAEAQPVSTEPQRQTALETRAEPTEQQAPAQPVAVDTVSQVQVGDLVTPGPNVTTPRVVSPARPIYPMMARRLKKSAVVTVKVLIDENGQVLEAERLGDEAGFGFDNAAVQAALKSRWEPPTKDGVPVKMWWTVKIAFQP